MDITTFASLLAACAPLVHPSTAHALVTVESGFNSYAIGVVGGTLERQPRTLNEAISTVRMLESHGRNFSVGLAQINVANWRRFGLSSRTAFDPCRNLSAMQGVLLECFARFPSGTAQHRLRHALSCYYSGSPATGIRNGYVYRVLAAAATDSSRVHPGAAAPSIVNQHN